MRAFKIILFILFFLLLGQETVYSVEIAQRISDREVVERLTRLEQGQASINKRLDNLRSEINGRFADLRSEMNGRFIDLRSEMNNRFDMLTWMIGLFVSIAMLTLGFVLRMQWQMNQRQTHVETALETQKDELNFLKELIGRLLPPSGAL